MKYKNYKEKFVEEAIRKGHILYSDSKYSSDGIDWFRVDHEFCNGPMCEKCHWAVCVHCFGKQHEISDIPVCDAV